MHYIGDAYYSYLHLMKSILSSIALVLTALSITAQPPTPDFSCGPSTWDGLGNNPTPDAQAFICYTTSAPIGKYIYWNPFVHNPDMTELAMPAEDFADWNWDNIYGMKGRYGINFPSYLGDGDTLSAQVFETKLNPTSEPDGDLQTFTDHQFDFYGGNYKFNILHLEQGTIVKVHPGASIEIHTALSIEYGAVLEIMPGATVLLKATRDNIAVTDIDGAIEGTLQKEVYFDVSDTWQSLSQFNKELRFVFNPGMYNVDLHKVALDIQAAATVPLAFGNSEPSVQIGYWGKRPTFIETQSMYDFAAIHTYESPSSSFELVGDSNLFVGEAVLNTDGFVISENVGQEFALRTNSMAGNFYNYNEGVSILPIYPPTEDIGTSDEALLNHWFNSDDFTGFADETINTTSDISSFSKTPIELDRTFAVSLTGVTNNLGDFKIVVEGKFDSNKFISVQNATISPTLFGVELPYPGATATYIGYPDAYPEQSLFFESTAIADPPNNLLFGVDLYSRTGADDYSLYRGVDFSGLSVLNNRTGNYLDTYETLFTLLSTALDAQLALFDIAPLIGRQDSRDFKIDADTDKMYESTSGEAFPIPVSNLLIWDDTAPQYPGVEITDFYNIEDMKIFYAIGDTIRPDEMLAYNYNNPCNPQTIEGVGFDNYATFQEIGLNWLNKGGVSTSGAPVGSPPGSDTVYATRTNAPVYRKTEQAYVNNKPVLGSIKEARVPVGPGNVGSTEIYDWTIEELNDMNEFTLLRLAGVTLLGDTLTIAIVPLATDEDYSATDIDLFESSVAVNPIMYLLPPTDVHVMSRKWGSYGRGINDFNDSLQLVIDFEALDFVTNGANSFSKLFIDAPVKQVGACGLSGDNLVVATSTGNLYTWAPDFEYEIDMNSTYNMPNESGSSGDYGSGAVVDLYFTTTQADFNGDGCVTTADLLILLGHFGTNVTPGNFQSVAADLNCDGVISTSDLLIYLGFFGQCGSDSEVPSEEAGTVLEKRVAWYFGNNFDNDHVTYDIIDDYPSFSQSQRDFLNLWPYPGKITVVDDLNMVIADKWLNGPTTNNGVTGYSIELPANMPTSAQLDTTSAKYSVDLPQTDPSYRIYIEWRDAVRTFPGIPGSINHICLGCKEDPNAIFPLTPTFVAN